ncbi:MULTISPECIES: hypothetical protein [Clostridia]|uniref:hypothetical protein n=1 Tax=Clostridia TaxID=186801 RepID=UPI001FA9954E|nr:MULTISPECIES: hypothetical protein [Clostridia]
MDKYEYKLKTEQMLELMEDGAYSRAAELADSIDWRRVRNTTMLMNVSDIYEKSRDYHKSFEVLKIAYHRAEGSRKIVYRLCTLALKTRNVDEAIDYYDEFLHIAPKDPNQYILKYQILKVQRAPIEQQIDALESFKKAEYVEEWAYELAKLYERAGKITECLEECDDLILWFSEGKYVYQAMELKMRYKPLTPSQQEKYNRRYEKPGTTTEELPDLNNVDENGVKVAAKPVSSTQEQTEEDAAKTAEKAESDKSAESEPDIKIPVVEETLANKFVDEDVVKAEVRAKAKAEILGEADSFEPTSIDSLTEAIRKAAETETAEQEALEEKEEQEPEEIAEKTESSEDVKEQVLASKEDSVDVETESEVEEKQPEKKKIGNTMRLDEALKALLHIDGSDSGSRESSDEEAEKKEDDLSDLNDAIEDIEDVVDLSLVQKVEQKRAQKKALEAVKDVKVDSDLEELSMKKLKSKSETTVNLDDTLPMNLDDTVEMSPEEIIAMYGGTEETIEEESEAEEIIEPEEEEIIEEEPEAEEIIEPEEEEIIEEEPEAEEIIEPEEEEIIEEEPEAEEIMEPEEEEIIEEEPEAEEIIEPDEEEPIDEDEILEVEQVLEAKYIEPADEEEDQLDNQVTARMSLEELFAAWDEEDALAEAEEFEEAEAEEIIEEKPEAEEIVEPEAEEIIEEKPEAEEIIEPEEEEIIEEEPEAEEIIEPEAEEITEEKPEAEEIIEPEAEEIIEEEPEAEETVEPEVEEIIEEEPETEGISEEDILNLDSAEEWSDDEMADAFEENSDNKAESVEEIDEALNEAESVKDIKQAEPEKEETMSVERKTGEPILPPDIQRLIDEIEGVIPREDEEPMSESSTSASKIQERMPEDNMEQEMDMLRVDDSDEYEDEYADEFPVEEEESLEAVQPQGGYTQEFERIMDDRFASFEAEEDYSDELGDLYPDMEDDISDEVDAIALEEEAFEQETEIDLPEYEDEEYPEDEYEDEYEDEEYPEDEYEDEYEDEEYPEDEYEDEYEDEEYPEDEYEDEYEDEEYLEDEYEDEYEDEEYPEDEYEDEYEDEEYPEDEYEDEYEDEEYPEDEYEDEYEDEEYPEDEYEDEYEDEEYPEDEYEDEYEYEDDEEYDAAAQFEAEFRPQSSSDEYDDRLIEDEDDDDGVNFLSKTAPLSRKETAKLIATGKTAPLPLDEISNALSISDTGFLVHNRHELLSEAGKKKTELTADQKRLFSYFVPVRGMSEQLVDVLEQDKNCTNRRGTSRTGNLLIIGNKGNGKTVLAVDVVKAIQRQRNIHQGKVAIVTGESLNKKKIGEIFRKLYGGALIIEKAGKLNERTVAKLNKVMEQDTGELLIVLEDQRKPLDRLLSSNREFRKKFTSRLEVPIFINDELVTFGQTYAQENGYRIDEMGLLALYSRIDALQREDHFVTVAEVKEIMDEAMEHSKKASARKLVKRVFGKGTDEADRILLTEKDFNI